MGVVKSFSVGDGDMFYIRHGTSNFTVIDCCNYSDGRIIDDDLFHAHLYEIRNQSKDKDIKRFISTHPDEDHISGLSEFREEIGIVNFYCVKNEASKDDESDDFIEYCSLRDDKKKAFYIFKGCKRRWMNEESDERGSAGINCLWPVTSNTSFKDALKDAKNGKSPNNISPILTYSVGSAKFIWMGDLEADFLEKVKGSIRFPEVAVLFAPHHGRESGKIPTDVLAEMNPKIIVIGEAPSKNLNYYRGYNTITQNSAGDIVFETCTNGVNVYVGNENYSADYLYDDDCPDDYGCHYIGTLYL